MWPGLLFQRIPQELRSLVIGRDDSPHELDVSPKPLGYAKWERFEDTIERAIAAAENSGLARQDHFPDTGKVIDLGKGMGTPYLLCLIYTIGQQVRGVIEPSAKLRKDAPELHSNPPAENSLHSLKTQEGLTPFSHPALPTLNTQAYLAFPYR